MNIDSHYLSHLRLAANVVLIGTNPEELQEIMDEFVKIWDEIVLSINVGKTKVLSLDNKLFRMGNNILEKVEYIYLGPTLKLEKENQTEINRRERMPWGATSKLHIKRLQSTN